MIALAKMILNYKDYIPEEVIIAEKKAEREAAEAEARATKKDATVAGSSKPAKKVKGKSKETKTVEHEALTDLAAAQKIMKVVKSSCNLDLDLDYGDGWEFCGPPLKKVKF